MLEEENQSNTKELEESGVAIYREEAAERLAELEETMLELELNPDDPELIGAAFRSLHTIKGSGGMFGFHEVERFTHDIETVYDQVRDGKIHVTEELIALTLSAHDQIGKMLEDNNSEEERMKRVELTAAFQRLLLPDEQVKPPTEAEGTGEIPKHIELTTYRIHFEPAPDIFAFGTNPLLLLNEIRELGDSFIIGYTTRMPPLAEMDPESCYIGWDIILTTNKGPNAIQDIFIFVDDYCDVSIKVVDTDNGLDSDTPEKKLGEILVDRGDIEQEELQAFLKRYEKIGQKLQNEGLVTPDKVQSALVEQQQVRKINNIRKKSDTIQSIRVASHKLDKLVDLVGELVTGQARLSQLASNHSDPTLVSIAEEIERLTAELRDNTMSVRMLTFGTTFNKFKRLIRDLSRELCIEAELITEGGDTELDKTVIDQLNDPLVHILRNSVDHGLESTEERLAAGKSKNGTIRLSAGYSGAHVIIKVQDDGSGLNTASIREKAIEKSIITSDSRLSDNEIHALIFEPGFSTASTVTNVSGRGVGMDVVKRTIESMRGTVEIDSVQGVGTTISIKLPLTLAIIDGLLVKVGADSFVIPLAAVKECVELSNKNIELHHGRNITRVREQIVPYIRLRDQFNVGGERPEIEQVVITEIDRYQVGFVVDHVIGQHQTVIKKLSKVYQNVDVISGATIMADGNVALILDINKHLHLVEKEYRGLEQQES